jgi:hypothetical protein
LELVNPKGLNGLHPWGFVIEPRSIFFLLVNYFYELFDPLVQGWPFGVALEEGAL